MLPPCEICGQPGHGNHFGVLSCRACAAFFRRAASSRKKLNNIKCPHNPLENNENGVFSCRKCRLRKCLEKGMDASKFQQDRDLMSSSSYSSSSSSSPSTSSPVSTILIPQSLASFLGRPNFLILCDPEVSANSYGPAKTIVDCNYLIDKAYEIFKNRNFKPYGAEMNSLDKLTMELDNMRLGTSSELQFLSYIEKEHTMLFWEQEFLNAAQWFSNFSEFTALPIEIQMTILKSVWATWGRLEKLAKTAEFRRKRLFNDNRKLMVGDQAFIDVMSTDADVSWFTDYTRDQISYFMDCYHNPHYVRVMEELEDLNPSSVELNFMLLQLCLQQAGKKLQGGVADVTDHLQDIISNQLHEYYLTVKQMSNYSGRLSKMMKINNLMRKSLWEQAEKKQIAITFDVFRLAFSHPDMMCS